jgi:hypothetical protein
LIVIPITKHDIIHNRFILYNMALYNPGTVICVCCSECTSNHVYGCIMIQYIPQVLCEIVECYVGAVSKDNGNDIEPETRIRVLENNTILEGDINDESETSITVLGDIVIDSADDVVLKVRTNLLSLFDSSDY